MISIIGAAAGMAAARLGRHLVQDTIPAPTRPSKARRLVPRYVPSFNRTKGNHKAYRSCKPGSLGSVKFYRRKRATKRGRARAKGGHDWLVLLMLGVAWVCAVYAKIGR